MNAEINSRPRLNPRLGKPPWMMIFFLTFRLDLAAVCGRATFQLGAIFQTPCFGDVTISFVGDEVYKHFLKSACL